MTTDDTYDELRRQLAALLGDSLDREVEKIVEHYRGRGLGEPQAREHAHNVAAQALEELKRRLLTPVPREPA